LRRKGFEDAGRVFQEEEDFQRRLASNDLNLERVDFKWLLDHLLSPNDRIAGCQLLIPDTAFFEENAPRITKTDKDGFVTAMKQKLSVLDLRNIF